MWKNFVLTPIPTSIEGSFEFRASKRGEKIGWQVAKLSPDGVDQDEVVMVPAFVLLFKHWKGTTTVGDELVEVTAWVEPEPGDELEAAQAQKKKRGGRGKGFGPYEVVKLMPTHQAVTLQQVVKKVEAAFRAKSAKAPSQRTIQRALQVAAGEVEDNGQLINLVEHKGRGYTRLGATKIDC